MKAKGFISAIICCYTKALGAGRELVILDGQNRALAAQYLNIPFDVIILKEDVNSKDDLIEYVSIYNNSSVPWRIKNYCIAYAKIGRPDYIKLMGLSVEHAQSPACLAIMLAGSTRASRTVASPGLKNGKFKIVAEVKTIVTLNLIKQLKHKMSSRMVLCFHSIRLNSDIFDFETFKVNFNKDYKSVKELRLDDYTYQFTKMGTVYLKTDKKCKEKS